ncbi:MAG: GNAT family N-acetyltransferase [Chloroflexota bacterium]
MLTITIPQQNVSDICRPILASVPQWFGIEEANQHYLAFEDANLTFVAYEDDKAVGFLSIKQHFPMTAEIYVMAVNSDYHRQGIGKALITDASEYLRKNGTQFLQVKTLSPANTDENYAKTRAFYYCMGFVNLEEFPTLWGKENPALQLIKSL